MQDEHRDDPRYYKNADAFDERVMPEHNAKIVANTIMGDLDNELFDDTMLISEADADLVTGTVDRASFWMEMRDGTQYTITVQKQH